MPARIALLTKILAGLKAVLIALRFYRDGRPEKTLTGDLDDAKSPDSTAQTRKGSARR
jgi:hypothetical protein